MPYSAILYTSLAKPKMECMLVRLMLCACAVDARASLRSALRVNLPSLHALFAWVDGADFFGHKLARAKKEG
jgi:hypothetical protein